MEERRDTIALDLVLRAQNPGLNPELVVAAIREHCPDAAPDFVSFHRRAVLDEPVSDLGIRDNEQSPRDIKSRGLCSLQAGSLTRSTRTMTQRLLQA